jgi:type I restriction enzyme S subunit
MNADAGIAERIRPVYKATEVGLLPDDWELRDIADLEPFVTSGSRGWAQYYSDIGSPFVRITNMSRDCIYLDLTDLKFVDLPHGLSEVERTGVNDGDVLISITADIGIVGYVDSRLPKPAYINQHLALVRFDSPEIDSKFVSYFLASEAPQRLFRGLTDQGAKAGMSLVTIRKLKVAHPSLQEQRAISAALSDVDALIGALDKLIVKKRAVKLATMQQIFARGLRIPGFTGEWENRTLGDVCRSITDGTHFTPHYVDIGIPFYSVENVTADNFRDPKFITAEEHAELIRRCKPEKGDILLTRIGELGSTKLLDWDVNASIYVSLALLKLKPNIDARYLYCYTRTSQFVEDLEARSLTNASPKKINMGEIASTPVPVPTLPEQRAIASVLCDMDTEISVLQRRREKAKTIKQGMMQTLLTGRLRLVKPEAGA